MPPFDAPSSRVPVASTALLSAAISGLLCFSASCKPAGPSDTPDGHGADASTDTHALTDTGIQPDAGSEVDAGHDQDAGHEVDAGNEVDAVVEVDSGSQDAGSTLDVAIDAGAEAASDAGVVIPPCDVNPLRSITSTMYVPGITLAAFTAECDAAGGHIEIHPHCGGANTCAGRSYDEGTSTLTEHSCQGLNTCNGFSCIVP